ncbi:MAG: pyrimidine-nucleoside phosphorylase [Saprospiraceae bacterium]
MYSGIQLIKKKRDGYQHTKPELDFLISEYTNGNMPDYQMAAWLMAAYLNGMTTDETAFLTEAMMHSGDIIDLSDIPGIKVDKHSTGGVGDKTSLTLGPLVASAGVYVAKMSGRGLGHTGGTLDKLESIPGFKIDMTPKQFKNQVIKHHLAICSQTGQLVPADKKIYALRDVTGTVDNLALIASSIMSKKIACGADAIVIDLKVGDGAFAKTIEEARKLSDLMISTAEKMGKSLVAVVTAMDQPLGLAIGNALEVKEAIDTLQGKGPKDFEELCLALGVEMLLLSKLYDDAEKAEAKLKENLHNGQAYNKFCEMVIAQGGDLDYVENIERYLDTKHTIPFTAKQTGYIQEISAMNLGLAAVSLGAGRETKESDIDHNAGIVLHKKIGIQVETGDPLATIYTNDTSRMDECIKYLQDAFVIGETYIAPLPLILSKFTK